MTTDPKLRELVTPGVTDRRNFGVGGGT